MVQMKVSVIDKIPPVDGWVFLPLKKVTRGVSGVSPQPFPGLPIDIHEWGASSEGAWQAGGKAFFKAAPVNGEAKSVSPFQDALGRGLKFLSQRKVKKVAVVLPRLADMKPEVIDALFEVPDLMTYDTAPYKTRSEAKKPLSIQEIFFICREKEFLKSLGKRLERMRVIADATNFARKAADEPSNLMTPAELAKYASLLKKDGVKVSVLPESIVKKMGGVQAVSAGSSHPPKFIVMELNPGKGKPIVLIGKGVTFDSGGISIKPADLMWEMKHDMAGGAAVIGAMKALAGLGCRRRIIGLVPAVENMPDGKAVRPGDVIKMFDGQTVEVLNTDAEGRLILADALAYSSGFNAEFTVDLATLTGAIIVALGSRFAGLFCNDKTLEAKILESAGTSGDLIWPMPLHPIFTEEMKSQFSDWKNAGGRKGGACLAAAFLSAFVKGPWAHLDIAGPTVQEKERPFMIKGGATGIGVKILANLLTV